MTDRTVKLNDETRDEIVRLARKGWSANEIALDLNADVELVRQDEPDLEPEQVQQVIDKANATDQSAMPQNVRLSKSQRLYFVLQEAVRQNRLLWLAGELAGGPVSYARIRQWYKDLGREWTVSS